MILHFSDALTSNVWQGSLKWKKKSHLFFCSYLGYLEISRQLPNFIHISPTNPTFPVPLTLLQTSDTVDSAHIQISIHLNLLLVAVLWQLFLVSGLTSWREQGDMTKGTLWIRVCTREIKEYVSSMVKLWQLSNLHTNTFPYDFLLVLLCIF